MTAYNIRTLPETMFFDCNSKEPITSCQTKSQERELQTIYPGKIKAIDDAVNELKQNSPLGGIDPNALAKKAVMMLALISKTLLYSIDCFATTNCNSARMTPKMKATGVSIQRAPKAKAVVRANTFEHLRPTHTEANPYMNTTTQRRYNGGFFTISSRSLAASSTPITSWMTP